MPATVSAALMLLLGVLVVQWLPRLPPYWLLAVLLAAAALLAWRAPRWRWLSLIVLGVVWASWHGATAMQARLPVALSGNDFLVTGTVAALPQVRGDATSFNLRVEQVTHDGEPFALRGILSVSCVRAACSILAAATASAHRWSAAFRRPATHVGVAAVFGVGLAVLLYALWPKLGWWLPRTQAQAASALLVAGIYSALAGFGLPTVRTLLMIAVVALARCSRRGGSGVQSLTLAMLSILLCDPLAVLAPGFWLSFIGVSFLMLCLQAKGRGLRGFLHELSAGQLVMTVSLLPLSLWFFGEASLVGALSNLIAVPVISFIIVPCALAGVLLMAICPPLATPVLWLAAQLAHAQWWLLEKMATWPGAHWYLPTVQPWALLLALLGALWLFLPRGVPLRWLGVLLFLPLLRPPIMVPAEGAFQAWVLDVGQGLSVVLRTRGHVLVYDTGAKYPSGFDLGESTVLPSMHALGMNRLDLLMISHGDNDHAGGAQAVASAFPDAPRYAGEPSRMPVPMQQCRAGQGWQWDGVAFQVLNPPADPSGTGRAPTKDNDRSCVLLVEGPGGRLLLTGDISTGGEPQVLAEIGPGKPPVLVIPHHGSSTSSSAGFINALQPPFALVSAGWHNHFGHPRPDVMARYAAAGVPVSNTADEGAMEIDFPADGAARRLPGWRFRERRYWRE
ncbi:MAG: hypothetical protein WDW36_006273 [Sanguina aurantia]